MCHAQALFYIRALEPDQQTFQCGEGKEHRLVMALIMRLECVNGFHPQLLLLIPVRVGEECPVRIVIRLEADRVAVRLVAFDVERAFDDFKLCQGDSSLS
jgi:hypothetical protein